MASPRIIKKYPNRRLYDTRVSSYITLEEVRQLVLSGESFEIIAEHEQHGQPIFSTALLSQIIRFYGDVMQGFVGNYLENSLKVFLEQQHKVRDQLNNLLGQTPWSMLNEITERNIDLWKSLQPGATPSSKPAPESGADEKKSTHKRPPPGSVPSPDCCSAAHAAAPQTVSKSQAMAVPGLRDPGRSAPVRETST
jgi:polyhydroxyalkanoate synthesis regulator protein